MKKLQTSKGFTPLNPEEKQEFCQKQNYLTGFTLVEMIVSLGLFTVILFISMQALLSMVDANHKAQSLRAAMDNLNLSLEETARNITQGNAYRCDTSSAPCEGTVLRLKSYTGDQLVYKLEAETLKKSVDGGASFTIVTAPSITINYLNFNVTNNGEEPPRVIISIQGTAGTQQGVISSFNIQTTAVQRTPE